MKTNKIIFHEPNCKNAHDNLQLLRVTLTHEHCKFDFGYQATGHYIKGGWVKMGKETYIKLKGSEAKHKLIKADYIPIGPEKHHFETASDWLYFSLYFPQIPLKGHIIDLIEAEPGEKTDFNILNIELNEKTGMKG